MSEDLERATMRKVSVRLLPVLFVLYIAAYLDRTNVGLASLTMNKDVGLSAAAYGFGAGVFFISYGLFEIPSNLFLARVGARRWLARIAVTWGILACAMMFVRGSTSFYVLRFLLGAAEAGAFPGIVYYLSQWFPERQRASAMSRFMVSIPIAGAIGGPVGGVLLSLDGKFGLAGWQWLFIVEGLPSLVLGVAVWFMLTDRPEDAEWLSRDEQRWLIDRLAEERRARANVSEHNVLKALTSGKVWWLALLYFFAISAYLGPIFFGPVIVAEALKIGSMKVGLVMGAIGLAGVAGMLINGPLSDRKQERIVHAIVPMIIGAIGFALSAMAGGGVMVVVGLAMISFAVTSFLPVFWCLPAALLSGSAAAGGIALINSIGNFGGFFAPNIVGIGKSMTGTYSGSLWILCGFCVLSALMILPFSRSPALRQRVK